MFISLQNNFGRNFVIIEEMGIDIRGKLNTVPAENCQVSDFGILENK